MKVLDRKTRNKRLELVEEKISNIKAKLKEADQKLTEALMGENTELVKSLESKISKAKNELSRTERVRQTLLDMEDSIEYKEAKARIDEITKSLNDLHEKFNTEEIETAISQLEKMAEAYRSAYYEKNQLNAELAYLCYKYDYDKPDIPDFTPVNGKTLIPSCRKIQAICSITPHSNRGKWDNELKALQKEHKKEEGSKVKPKHSFKL